MSATPTADLAKLVRQKRRVLEQLHAVGRRQGELIGEGDIQSLLKLLSAKQRLITALRATEQQLEPFRGEDPEARRWATPAERVACAADATECTRLLAEVLAFEKHHEGHLTERRDAVSQQLRQAQSAHTATAAYQPHVRPQDSPTIATPSPNNLASSLDLMSSD